MYAITNRRAALGILLVAIGAVILLENLDILPNSLWWIFKWYTLVLALGIFNLVTGNRTAGIILSVVGALFLFNGIGFFDLNWKFIWPAVLIFIGLVFIFKQTTSSPGVVEENEDFFDVVSIFGGTKQSVTGSAVRGGRITSIFGGSEIDLSHAALSPGATIEVFTLLGGTKIRVPGDWRINVEVSSIMGGFDTKRTPVNAPEAPLLRIKGTTILGGGEVIS